MDHYYDCKLMVVCTNGIVEFCGYRYKLAKSSKINSIFRTNIYEIQKDGLDLLMVYKMDSPFTSSKTDNFLNMLHNDTINTTLINEIIFFEIFDDDLIIEITNCFNSFDYHQKVAIREYFIEYKNKLSLPNIIPIEYLIINEYDEKIVDNQKTLKLILINGQIELPFKITNKYGNIEFNLVGGEENEYCKTIGIINDINLDKLIFKKINIITPFGTKHYNYTNIIQETEDFIEISMKDIPQKEVDMIKYYIAIITFNKK